MKIDHHIIRLALLGFLELLESADKQATIETLELWLGQLAFLQHFVDDIPDANGEYSARSARDATRWRKLIGEQFPALGYYKLSAAIPAQTGVSEISADDLSGDAVNDLAEIAAEISECLRRWESAGDDDALGYFRFGYQAHWGTHLRNLQLYLHNLH